MKKKYLHIIIGLVIIVCSLYYAFKDVSIPDIVNAFKSVRYIYVLPAVFGIALSYLLKAMRWRYLIASVKEVKTKNLFSPMMIGFMGNMLPGRAGEFIRPYLLSKKENISFSSSFATVFIERLFDMSMVLFLLIWVLLFEVDVFMQGDKGTNHALLGYMIKFGWASFIGFIFIFVFSITLQFKNDLAMRFVKACMKPLPDKWGEKIIGFVHSFNEGLNIVKDRRGFLATLLLTLFIWFIFVATNYPLYLAFSIHNDLPTISSLIILCLTVGIFMTLFPSPGFLGSFQAAHVVALHEVFGVSKAIALSFGIISWLVVMGFTVIVGAIYAFRDHISFGEISAEREQIS